MRPGELSTTEMSSHELYLLTARLLQEIGWRDTDYGARRLAAEFRQKAQDMPEGRKSLPLMVVRKEGALA